MPNDDTIAAIATPIGVAGIGVIRISGPQSLDIAKACMPVRVQAIKPRYVTMAQFQDPDTDKVIDQVCVIYFQAPHSFTGEDIVEIQCHSSTYILKTILGCVIKAGARMASAGEFSKRAFIHGKFNLTQAESIIDLIHAETDIQHQVSLNRVEGKLYQHIQAIREQLLRVMEQIEGSIDFPDEVPAIDREKLKEEAAQILKNVSHILGLQDKGKLISGGVHCVIVGRPNVGKSSLFNGMLGEQRSIVTEIPGTTRDYISECIEYRGYKLHVYDTAGMRETENMVEFLGIEKVKALLKQATLILWVVDISEPYNEEDNQVYKQLSQYAEVAYIQNKSDKATTPADGTRHDRTYMFQHHGSAHVESDIKNLKEKIYHHVMGTVSDEDLQLLCNIRQSACIQSVHDQLQHLIHNIQTHTVDDMLAIDIRACVESCSELTGDALTEEMLDGVFSRFCVGK